MVKKKQQQKKHRMVMTRHEKALVKGEAIVGFACCLPLLLSCWPLLQGGGGGAETRGGRW
jgi:hypothetical protein